MAVYRLHEVVEDAVGGERELTKRNWAPSGQLSRFKHSANSVDVAGDDARHGAETTTPPKRPMTLDEAQGHVHLVLRAWLDEKNSTPP